MSLAGIVDIRRRSLRRRTLDSIALADQARDAGQWGRAAQLYRKIVDRNPRNAGMWVQYGHALKESGELRDPAKLALAEAAYRKALSIDPGGADTHLQLGHVLKLQGKTEDAQASYLRSFALDPSMPYPVEELYRLGWSELQVTELRGLLADRAPLAIASDVAENDQSGLPEVDSNQETRSGWSGRFDAQWYLEHNLDVARGGMDPLEHFLKYGLNERRKPYASAVVAGAWRPVTDAEIHCMKEPLFQDEVAIFATYSPDGQLKPHVQHYLDAFIRHKISVILIMNTDNPGITFDPQFVNQLGGAFIRRAEGYDFAAWAHVLQLYPKAYKANILYLVNDSVIGPTNDDTFGKVLNRLRNDAGDLIGLTDNIERGWHLQSYFLALKPRALLSSTFQNFVNGIVSYDDKVDVINEFEVQLTPILRGVGLDCKALFSAPDDRNPAVHHWKPLLQSGFPFVKVEVLRGVVPDLDISDWRELLAAEGYDVSLAERTVAEMTPPDLRSRIEATGLFNPETYLSLHADLRAAGREGWEHYLAHGLEEGRQFTSSEVVAGALVKLHSVLERARDKYIAAANETLARAGDSANAKALCKRGVKIGVFHSSVGNYYMSEFADLLVSGLRAEGCNAVQRDETNSKEEPFALRVFVAPHEFFTLGEGRSWVDVVGAPNSVLYNVEQMQTPWFCRIFNLLLTAPLVLDANFHSAEILRRAGCNIVHFMPGYLPTSLYARPCLDMSEVELVMGYAFARQPYNWLERNELADRPIDLLFIGSSAPRRDKALERLQHLADEYRFLCVYTRQDSPLTERNYRATSSEINCGLGQRAKIVLNIHRDWLGYFEWSRMVMQGMWQGACVVSDPCLPNPLFEAGKHYLEENIRHIGELARWLLGTGEGNEKLKMIRLAGYERAMTLGSMHVALAPVLEAFKGLLPNA
jgi:hypothetical protein